MSVDRLRVVIGGGGIGGLAAANVLSQRGIDVRVYVQAEQLAQVSPKAICSIARAID